jgi:hypothetical protein
MAAWPGAGPGALLGPGVGEIGMRERFGLIAEQQHDVASFGLRFQQLATQAATVHGVGILATLQRVAGAAPAEPPFLRSTTESREREIRTPERFSISSARRGSVQFGRSATGADKTSSATSSARKALTGTGPGGTRALNASTPPVMNVITPQPHRVLANAKCLGQPRTRPSGQGQQDAARAIRFGALT